MATGFIALLPAVVIALAILVAPGALVLRVAGMPTPVAVLAAPALSLDVLLAAGALSRLVSQPFTLGFGVLVLVLLTSALAGVCALLARRFGHRGPQLDRRSWPSVTAAASLGLAAVGFSVAMGRAIRSPEAWPQMPDDIFHVGAVTWMVRHGSAYAGDALRYTQSGDGGASYYPGAWHALVATISAWSGSTPLASSHAVIFVVGGALWPASMVLLGWRVLGASVTATAGVALASVAFLAMPYQPLASGVLWPYFLATALLPSALAFLHALLDRGNRSWAPSWVSIAMCGATLVAAGLSHPSAVFSMLMLGGPMAVALVRRWHSRRVVSTVALAVIIGSALAWLIRPQAMVDTGLGQAPSSVALAGGRLLATVSPVPAIALAGWAVVILGLVSVRRPDRGWLWWGLIAPVAMGSFLWILPHPIAASLAWPWWNDPARLRTLAGVSLTLVVGELSLRLGREFDQWNAAKRSAARAVVVAALGLGVMGNSAIVAEAYYPTSLVPWWVTAQGREDLAQLAVRIPLGGVVAANPYSGGTHLYLTRDVRLLYPNEWILGTDPRLAVIAGGADRALSDPAVCRALNDFKVQYVLSGGQVSAWNPGSAQTYQGLSHVGEASGYKRIETRGAYTLWKVPDCAA